MENCTGHMEMLLLEATTVSTALDHDSLMADSSAVMYIAATGES